MVGIRELLDIFNASVILLKLAKVLQYIYITLLDEVDDGAIVSTFCSVHFSSSIFCSTHVSTISDITLNVASSSYSTLVAYTIDSLHTDEKYGDKHGIICNRTVRGCYNVRLPNGSICLNITLWFWNLFNKFNKKAYYCKKLVVTALKIILTQLPSHNVNK